MTRPTTLRDIAEVVGVSISTVASVLNPGANRNTRVGEALSARIRETASNLNYQRNRSAARLKGDRSGTLGILVDGLSNALTMPIADSFEKEASGRGYTCFVGSTHYTAWRKQNYVRNFLELGVDGIFLTIDWKARNEPKAREMIAGNNVGLVLSDFNWRRSEDSLVTSNHFEGGRLLAQHLLEVGHRRVIYLIPDWLLTFFSFKERIRGARAALRQAGRAEADLHLLPVPFGDPKDYAAAVMAAVGKARRTTAVMCANDGVAIGLMIGLHERGIAVPDRLAITGYDDFFTPMLQSWFPGYWQAYPWLLPITTIRQPHHAIGKLAAEVLIGNVEAGGNQERCQHLLDVELIIGASSRLPTTRD